VGRAQYCFIPFSLSHFPHGSVELLFWQEAVERFCGDVPNPEIKNSLHGELKDIESCC